MERFQNVGRVGDGAYGIVYKALDRNTDKLYALKKVRSTTDREGVRSFIIFVFSNSMCF